MASATVQTTLEAELRKTKDQVLALLDRYPNARNNDFYLQLLWLKSFGGIKDIPFVEWTKIRELSGRLESVRRMRQKVQNEMGLYPPTDPEILRRRQERQELFRQAMGHGAARGEGTA